MVRDVQSAQKQLEAPTVIVPPVPRSIEHARSSKDNVPSEQGPASFGWSPNGMDPVRSIGWPYLPIVSPRDNRNHNTRKNKIQAPSSLLIRRNILFAGGGTVLAGSTLWTQYGPAIITGEPAEALKQVADEQLAASIQREMASREIAASREDDLLYGFLIGAGTASAIFAMVVMTLSVAR